VKEIVETPIENMVFLDEAGVNLNMTRTHARAPEGERAVCLEPKKKLVFKEETQKESNVTLLGALSWKKIVLLMRVMGSAKLPAIETFMEALLTWLTPGMVVIWDNLRAHHNKKILDRLANAGIKVIFLPPYSPELNPIELCWSKLKTYLRKVKKRLQAEFYQAIKEGSLHITAEDIYGWFGKCGYV
jgi:hypothetical protein